MQILDEKTGKYITICTKHFLVNENDHESICKIFNDTYSRNSFLCYVTTDKSKVNCKRCLKSLSKLKIDGE